jgi:hypothetical protein
MATHKEYEEWKADPVAQQEYKEYLFREIFQTAPITDPLVQPFFHQFTRQFETIFKEKS